MSLTLGDNFDYKGAKPLDGRLKYATLADMTAMSASTLYDGIIAYCVGEDKNYQWKSTNTVDTTLGKWRELETGGSSSDPTKADLTSIAPTFDAMATYAKGDIVSYNGKVYRFNDDHTGSWVTADADEITIGEEIEDLSDTEMQAVKDAFTGGLQVPFATTMDVIDLRENERVVGKVILTNGTEKTLYEKILDFGALPNSATTKSMAHGISNVSSFYDINGYVYTNSGTPAWGMLNLDPKVTNVYCTATTAYVTVNDSHSDVNVYFVIRYTKTA